MADTSDEGTAHVENSGIEVDGVRKRYGATLALDGISFAVAAGQVTGFIGPNGAGKSTAIRVILGLDAPDEGEALVLGQHYPRLRRPLTKVGALLEVDALTPSRSARNHLLWLAHSQRLTAERVDVVLDLVGLREAGHRKAGGFSLGMRQRLGIAGALLGDPQVLIFDEPFNGMDPEGIRWLRGFLPSLAAEGRAVFVSSHLMSELQGIADRVVVIGRGAILADATISELLAGAAPGQVVLRTTEPAKAAEVVRRAGATAITSAQDTLQITGLDSQRIVDVLGTAAVPFSEVTTQQATLEDVYLRLTAREADYRAGTASEDAR